MRDRQWQVRAESARGAISVFGVGAPDSEAAEAAAEAATQRAMAPGPAVIMVTLTTPPGDRRA